VEQSISEAFLWLIVHPCAINNIIFQEIERLDLFGGVNIDASA
jgi:hypothetical protein